MWDESAWVRLLETDLEECSDEELFDLLQSLQRAWEEAAEAGVSPPVAEPLGQLIDEVWDAEPDTLRSALQEFRQRHGTPPLSAQERLESELRGIAAGLSEDRWCSGAYRELEQAVEAYLGGGQEEDLTEVFDRLEDRLEQVHQGYLETPVVEREVTVESVVTHQLLQEGLQGWREVLHEWQGEEAEEPDWDELLLRAEQANRLLIALQVFERRLRGALNPY